MPASLAEIGYRAFYGCTGLISLTIDSANAAYKTEGNILYNKAGTTLIFAAGGLSSANILNTVTTIGDSAFSKCTGLTSVHLPANLTTIGEDAFYECTGLTSISLPANLTTIGGYAFYSCTGLTSVHLPANLTEIGEAAFEGCTGLTSLTIDSANAKYKTEGNILYNKAGTSLIFAAGGLTSANIPDTVTTIGVGAFASCTGLTSISLPANLTEIGKYAFYECTGLTSIRLPANLAQIGRGAFYGCEGLTSAVFADKNNWKVYDDEAHTQNETEINSSDLDNAATAAKYLLETYADKYWKKN